MKKLWDSLLLAISTYTVLPTSYRKLDADGFSTLLFFPFCGAIIGGFLAVCVRLNYAFNIIPNVIAACLFVILLNGLCGFLHIDALSDVADAVLSRRERDEKLRILKDSHIGTFGVTAIISFLLLEGSSFYVFLENNSDFAFLVGLCIVSRSISAYFLCSFDILKESSLGKYFKGENPKKIVFLIIIIVVLVFYGILFSKAYVFSYLFGIVSALLCFLTCSKNLGGVNGDVAGSAVIVSETVMLLCFCVLEGLL